MAFKLLNFEKGKIQKGQREQVFNTETMLPISEVRGDTLVLKDGGLRAIIRVSGLNLDLKNADEQDVVIQQYKRFLNGLDFPIQILVRSTYLDLTHYLNYMKDNVEKIDNDVLKQHGDQYVSFLDNINLAQGLIYVKEFYIIIPYYDETSDEEKSMKKSWRQKFLNVLESKDSAEKIVQRYRSFVRNRKFLDTRCALISEGLKGLNIDTERLELSDIVALLFKFYNPTLHNDQAETAKK